MDITLATYCSIYYNYIKYSIQQLYLLSLFNSDLTGYVLEIMKYLTSANDKNYCVVQVKVRKDGFETICIIKNSYVSVNRQMFTYKISSGQPITIMNLIKGKDIFFLTHNREYWNASLSVVVCRLS